MTGAPTPKLYQNDDEADTLRYHQQQKGGEKFKDDGKHVM